MGVVRWWIDPWTKFGNPSNCISLLLFLSQVSSPWFPSRRLSTSIVVLSDPWPILSFTFSHNRLLMDFREFLRAPHDALQHEHSIYLVLGIVSFLLVVTLPFGHHRHSGSVYSQEKSFKFRPAAAAKKLRVNARPWNTGENWKIWDLRD